jgi:hypothetical protein
MYPGSQSYFPGWLQQLLKFDYCSEGNYYFLHCFTMMEPIIQVNPRIKLNCNNSLIILDEILILFPKLLDFKRLAKKYKLYLKRKSRKVGMIEVDPDVLKLFTEHEETILPVELYGGYHAIIGNNSTALKMPKSISVCIFTGEPDYNWAETKPKTLEELYLYLEC